MAQIYTRQRLRCTNHPHRDTEQRCGRCALAFCPECLSPGDRALDGTRPWYCATCVAAIAEAKEEAARARSLEAQVERMRRAGGGIVPAAGLIAVVAVLAVVGGVAATFLLRRGVVKPNRAPEATCGELSRIRSVGAIGIPSPSEVVNMLTYPARADVRVTDAKGVPTGTNDDASAAVDECDTGWRSAAGVQLPVNLVFTVARDNLWMQRVTLWQDPTVPRSMWAREVQLLVSPSESGDDFQPLLVDRPQVLLPSVEQQWFQVVQPPPQGGVSPAAMPPEERARYAQSFPGVVPVRRLMVRILSTHAETNDKVGPAALGEAGMYGADLEVEVLDQTVDGGRTGNYYFSTGNRQRAEIRALAGRPVSVLLINRSVDAHTFATGGQDKNLSIRAEAGGVASGQFVASSKPGQFEFICNLPSHSLRGLRGAIVVR